ncbi:unnamed protein product [Ectocarpus sp. 4 AP-2014]
MGLPDGCLEGAVGGAILGTTTTVMLAATGKLAGLSGIFDGVFSRTPGRGWKVLFLSGFTVGGVVAGIVYPAGLDQTGAPALSPLVYAVAGFLVGLGTRLGSGCTSGHGLCGLPRLSRRSIVATLTFLTSGIATASVFAAWNDSASGGAVLVTHEAPVLAARYASLAAAAVGTLLTLTKREERAQWKAHLASFLCGGSFAGGLVLSGMTQRAKVVNFLALRRNSWDPSLMFVLGFGVMVGLVGFPLVTRNLGAPLCRLPAKAEEEQSLATGAPLAEKFEIPTGTELDVPLVLGGWLFGIGWGMGGLCPGPAVVAATFGLPGPALAFMPSLVVGMRAAGPLKGALSLPHPSWVTGDTVPLPNMTRVAPLFGT